MGDHRGKPSDPALGLTSRGKEADARTVRQQPRRSLGAEL